MKTPAQPRPEFRNIHITDLRSYRLPPAGIVSILHRISGLGLFLLLPFIVWIFDRSLSSMSSYEALSAAFSGGTGIVLKIICLGLIWAFLHHLCAGVRHLWFDATHQVSKEKGHSTALATFAVSIVLTLLLAAKLFGVF
ncbi:succinate dehydrogenase, cytochrome b556 subunit [Amphibiibacter pelophylacis]|uniref:Succinate dehydrogenase, cytochrome b556 subunit n=1 Tax=Amphibiibacter pelophylacis TaxID=1799477 RepID=A0ACC6P2Q3_9BURK